MKKILFISHTTNYEGAEQYLYDLISHIDNKKYKIYVCLPRTGNQILLKKLKSLCDLKIFQFEYRWVLSKRNKFRMIVNIIFQIYGIITIAILLKKHKIEIVYTNTSTICIGALAAKLLKIPHIWSLHEALPNNVYRFLLGKKIYHNIIYYLSDNIIANSAWTLSQYLPKVKDKTKIIYNGFNFKDWKIKVESKGEFKKKYKLNGEETILGVVGTITPHKGHHFAIKALRILNDMGYNFRLLIFGQSYNYIYKKQLDEYITRNHLNSVVNFMNFVSDIDIIYPLFDILIIPSTVESFGRVVVEGCFYECIVLAFNVGGIPEIINHGENGYLIKELSPQILAEKILFLTNEKKYSEKLKSNARKSVLRFSLDNFIKQTETVLQNVNDKGFAHM